MVIFGSSPKDRMASREVASTYLVYPGASNLDVATTGFRQLAHDPVFDGDDVG